MQSEKKKLTEAEWRVMEYLWNRAPCTGREVTEQMEEKEGWNRSTTLTLLSRLEGKGAVTSCSPEGKIYASFRKRTRPYYHRTQQ